MKLFGKYMMWQVLLLSFALPADAEQLVKLLSAHELSRLPSVVRILDARPLAEWRAGHIPGALSFDWQHYTETDAQDVAYRKLPSKELAERLGMLGIDENSSLVIYGDADSSWGGEGWVCWLLRELGHVGEIYLLDGGVQAWLKLEGKLSTDQPPHSLPVVYRVRERLELDIETEALQQPNELQLVDTRSFLEWVRGAIPGAVRIPWTDFFQGEERRPLGREQLRALLQEHGVDPQRPVVYYCSGGIRSAYAWLVHELAGLPRAQNYEGGMEAWRRRE